MIEGRLLRRVSDMQRSRAEKRRQEIKVFASMGFDQERIAVLANCSQPTVSMVLREVLAGGL